MSEQLNLIPDTPQGHDRRGTRFVDDDAPVASRRAISASGADKRAGASQRGLHASSIILAALSVAAILWGAWVTKNILDPGVVKAPIASVQLEGLIGEYVRAQARSNTPPEIVTQQTQTFMAALGEELKARGADGTTIMVGEAVLSQNVPDITTDLRRSIYAKVPFPSPSAAAVPAAIASPEQTPTGPATLPAQGQ